MNKTIKLINITLIFIIFYILVRLNIFNKFIYIFKNIFFPIVIAILIYYLLNPIKKMFLKKINKLISSILSIIILVIIIFLFFKLSLPVLIKEFINIYNNYGNYIKYFDFNNFNISNLINNILDIIYIIPIIIIIVFILLYKDDSIFIYLKNNLNDKLYNFVFNVSNDLEQYIKSLEIIIFIEIIEYSLFFYIIGHPYFYLLGFVFGIANIIPVFGSLFASFISLITAFNFSKKLFIFSVFGCLFIPLFDNYVIDPKVYGTNLNISFYKLIFIVFISKIVFGGLGMLFSIIIYIVVKNYIKFIS